MCSIEYLRKELGFRYLDSPSFCEKGRLKFNVKRGEHTSLVYAIAINCKVQYIGITSDFAVRTHTYRNAKYWENAWPSNKMKTSKLEKALNSGKQVEFYCVPSDNPESLERELIESINPSWNKIYCPTS